MSHLYVLFEHAAGYALFKVKEFEEAGVLLPQVEESVTDVSRFNSVVKLIGFSPFKTAAVALENANCISEGVLPGELSLFLETYLPQTTKKVKIILGVIEPKLGSAIQEVLPITCQHGGAVPEIVRGIRMHFHHLVKGFTAKTSDTAQLGLGHSYSRAKVKFNVNRADNMIIQSIALLDQLDKDINTFAMRIREWYSYHFPELVKIVPENYQFANAAKLIGNRKELTEEHLEALEEVVQDESKARAILSAAKSSMGMDISPMDLINVKVFAGRVVALADYRRQLAEYLREKMVNVAPSLATLVGEQVGARLIAHAGSLTNLAKYPASTVQILGAEKALFRALKTRGNTPKYGLLYHSTFIGRAGSKNKGRISRYLANKCSIASRIDCFAETPSSVYGEKLKQQVEDRLKFYESGEIPKKNIDVMMEAVEEAIQLAKSAKKKKKKDKKRKREDGEVNGDADVSLVGNGDAVETPPKKKKKKSKSVTED
ncbi:nucleolar protein 56 [Ischnura elegans]|uniref:nucleolar protein 56 n=1 Tax=Ischnura elegans TaxID=197161 RepID=UPI001ED8B50C|nr:nucleolar protein 56 [Ischnura elegans]